MVALDVVKASNARLTELGPGLVAVFVGGTSGIGLAVLKAFVRNATSPHVYVVGRSEPAAERIIADCKSLNGDSKVEFLKADVSELKEVDRVCEVIRDKEQRVNLLVQTQGNMNLRGNDVSPEGLDRKLILNYYSRMRFTSNLLPLLQPTTTTSQSPLSRVVSVLAAGHEGSINLSDIALKNSFSQARCANHSITMNSLMVSEFASRNPNVSFVHSHPAFVATSLDRELPFWVRIPLKALMPLIRPLSVQIDETGERHLFIATSGLFAPRQGAPGVEIPNGTSVAKGADGIAGSGGYLVNWDDEVVGKPIVKTYREEGVAKTIWEHTMRTFEEVKLTNEGRK